MDSPKPKDQQLTKKPRAATANVAKKSAKPRARRPKSLYTPAEVHEIFRRFAVQRPEPKGELEHVNAFTLLVAVVLSAQATDVSVNKATKKLYPVANTPAAILKLGEDGLREFIKNIGLFNSKAKNVIQLCRILLDEHGGEVPRDRDALERLPGVGRKTANVVLNTAFGEPTIAVDTHIFRVANRTGLAPGKNPREVEDRLVKFTADEFKKDAHHWLILHGRYVCKALKPECARCTILDLCEYRAKQLPETADAPLAPPAAGAAAPARAPRGRAGTRKPATPKPVRRKPAKA
jgi:endonuclease-3